MTGTLEMPFMMKQAKARDPLKHKLLRAKVVQVHQQGYIKQGVVVSGTNYFCVDKGTLDIRMVYNGTSWGLNTYLYALHYNLLSVCVLTQPPVPQVFPHQRTIKSWGQCSKGT
jgi:hypothetical protein